MILKVLILVAVSAVLVSGMELETKIRRIWNDIDIANQDGRITVPEIELYFSNFSMGAGEVVYPNFDYLWSEWYSDSRVVTQYLFDTWNVFPVGAPDNRLTVEDLAIVFNAIDTNLNLACPTNGYWDFFWEFHPYFTNLYKGAPGRKDSKDYCIHPEFPGYKVKTGSNIQTPTCLNITCFETTISVCEFGWRLARVVGLPEDCKKVKVGDCGVKFVKKDDESTLCFEDEGIEYNSL